jgi:hypothetical protein
MQSKFTLGSALQRLRREISGSGRSGLSDSKSAG